MHNKISFKEWSLINDKYTTYSMYIELLKAGKSWRKESIILRKKILKIKKIIHIPGAMT